MADLIIANEIRNQLNAFGRMKVWSWGANSWAGGVNFLTFKVQGFKFKGRVTITLNAMDLYDIRFTNHNNEIQKEFNGIYFDQMVDLIDDYVETDNGGYTKEQEAQIRGKK